ncbi:hypothetical protein ACSBOB_30895 [Mesorhizobium sp. ASY16-5R]|uniref:hypothetical protein n=1 Tax=Mesorhizobium sp. ASY16-5R TaxID=3445772 RepID=UPI003F9F1051
MRLISIRNTIYGLLSIVALLLYSEGSYSGDMTMEEKDNFKRAMELAGNNKCGEAWDLISSSVTSDDRTAAMFASVLIIFTGLVPPGSPNDVLALHRHALILALHGMSRNEPESLKHTKGLLMVMPDEGIAGEILSCIDGNGDLSICESIAVGNGLIPKFQSYLGEIDGTNAKNAKAYCVSPSVIPR